MINLFELTKTNPKPDKRLLIKLNGNSTSGCKLTLKGNKKTNLLKLLEIIGEKMHFKPNDISNLRLFNFEGLEIYEEDIPFLKNKETLYVSKGEDFKINTYYSEYKISKILGQGGFGKVYLGIHKKTKEKVAIKITNAGGIDNSDDIENIFSESETVKQLNHPNIVKIISFFVIKKTLQTYCIMEYLEGGELLNYVTEKKKLEEDETREIFKQIISAIEYCHKQKIIHRDLKLENILKVDNKSNKIKIVDFGIAGLCAGHKSEITKAGSTFYLPPEIFKKKNVTASPALDIWAIGCILYAMLVGKLPFVDKSDNRIIQKILETEPDFNKKLKLSHEVIDLCKKLLCKNPEKRIKMLNIKEHPWFLGKKFEGDNGEDVIKNDLIKIEEDVEEENINVFKKKTNKFGIVAKKKKKKKSLRKPFKIRNNL